MAETTEVTETTVEVETTEVTEPETTEPTPDSTDWKAEARKWERNAKKALADAESLRKQTMTDQEKAIEAARAEGRAEGTASAGVKLVTAEVRVAAAGRPVDVDALLEAIDPTKFLDEDGEPDRTAIAAWVDKVAPAAEAPAPGQPALGARRTAPTAPGLGSDPLLQALKNVTGAT